MNRRKKNEEILFFGKESMKFSSYRNLFNLNQQQVDNDVINQQFDRKTDIRA